LLFLLFIFDLILFIFSSIDIGSKVGAEVGSKVGAEVGSKVGAEVGSKVGAEVDGIIAQVFFFHSCIIVLL
jgi:hypothetical protein